ncbi:GntR family transcriptional regulator [Streptomyces mangrovi]|uniref:GntR family transcriptional regulator n=1 Tax=Streptomyces mangrovi TaxID=1206892 RepID=UPI00399C98B8
MRGYRELAEELRRRINEGEIRVGDTLPRITDLMREHGLARQTVRDAVGLLADEGLVVTLRRGGTVVRHRSPVQIPLSRYDRAMTPGGDRGPWETACAEQGLDGYMRLVSVAHPAAPEDLARLLELPPGAELVHRRRHAMIRPDDVVQVQDAWYPAAIAEAGGISGTEKVKGGVFRALTAAGITPSTATEEVASRVPTPEEASELRIGGRIPVLTVERVTRDTSGSPIEVLRTVGPADRLRLVYADLPLKEAI